MAADLAPVVTAACDGACSGNPGPGGWGALLRFEDGRVWEFGGREAASTNNRMELRAALALLEVLPDLPRHPSFSIRTDSRYLIDGFSKWLNGWKRKGWRTASGGTVLNRDLWEALDRARLPDVPFVHVRGHSGDPDNDRCDAIAVAFSRGGRPPLAGPGGAGKGGEAASLDPVKASILSVSSARASAAGTAQVPVTAAPDRAATDGDDDAPVEPAPRPLQDLLSRLELADRLARGGYGLSAMELAQLVEQPLAKVQARQRSWHWRDWQVRPQGDGRWRLVREGSDG
ncbi:ribonuclease H [Cyanobium sp. Morenito 9A2]|uniref:ribonuclease H family protein n=1 Tax=Cyanobium sp. Morenito 9A2 TaxID=2823718 RepID=UPI0020CFDA45|nr:ribonuclease H [Cyanobium sp. Morenito 9A2]MCP9850020.1 ribonuclease HI [Cyanobium sp. Morenito 9A2]